MIRLEHPFNIKKKPLFWALFVSILCLFLALYVVQSGVLRPNAYLAVLAALGLFQMGIQLVLFLHVGIERKPRWNILMFFLMVFVVVVIIGGSLWIMNQLDSYVMPS